MDEGLGDELGAEVEAIQSFLLEGEGEEIKVSRASAALIPSQSHRCCRRPPFGPQSAAYLSPKFN